MDEMVGTASPFSFFANFKMSVRDIKGVTGAGASVGAGGNAEIDEALAGFIAFFPVTRDTR